MPLNGFKPFSAILISLLIPFLLYASAPNVTQVSPLPQSMNALTSPEITVQFDIAIDSASVNLRTMAVFGRWAGACPGSFSFEDNDRRIRFTPSKSFSVGEWVTVSLSRGIRSSTGEKMEKGYAWNFWTASGSGTLDLMEIDRIEVREIGEGMIRVYGAHAGDLDGDGFHDFTVPNEDVSDIRTFINDGTGSYNDFTIYGVPPNSFPSIIEGADFNRDGFFDYAIGNIQGGSASIFLGDGQGNLFPHTTYPADIGTRGLTVLDANGDGFPDVVTANRASSNISILLNEGDGTFAEAVNIETGANGETSCMAADANGDGIMDIFVGAYYSDEMVVLLGDGDGNFAVSTNVSSGGDAWMVAVGDVDKDGHVDVVSANAGQNRLSLLRGDGMGNLDPPENYPTGSFPLAIALGDIDGDDDLDVISSNFSGDDWTIYENDGAGTFINRRTLDAQSAGSGAVLHDRDLDGDLDMTGIDEIADLIFMFENQGPVLIHGDPTIDPDYIDIKLNQSFPNPFYMNPRYGLQKASHITIPFSLPKRSRVKLEVFNVRGQRVDLLVDGDMPAGIHEIKLDPERYHAGIYFYRLKSDIQTIMRKIVIRK